MATGILTARQFHTHTTVYLAMCNAWVSTDVVFLLRVGPSTCTLGDTQQGNQRPSNCTVLQVFTIMLLAPDLEHVV